MKTNLTATQLAEITRCAETGTGLTKATVHAVGYFDKASRYRIYDWAATESSDAIRAPSRKWPFSEYKHAFTVRYAKQLAAKIGDSQ